MGSPILLSVFARHAANLETLESFKGDCSMNAHVRLVSPEDANGEVNSHAPDDTSGTNDDGPIGLPEEDLTSQSNVLGDTPPPLVVEREDRLANDRSADVKSKRALAKLLSLAWLPKTKPSMPNTGEAKSPLAEHGIDIEDNRAPDGAVTAATSGAPLSFASRRSVLMAALAAGAVIPAIVLLNWPRHAPPPIVEPGMLADAAKLMAPSAALATAPPREAQNVSRDRPIVHETRRDELSEMLSFKGAESTSAEAPAPANPSVNPNSARLGAGDKAQASGLTKVTSTASDLARSASGASGPPGRAPTSSSEVDAKSAEAMAQVKPIAPIHEMPAPQSTTLAAAPLAGLVQPQEPGLGAAAKIEARLTDLEAALKDRSNEPRARLEAEKAETHTLEKIAELGALVARLSGQVRDLQDQAQTIATVETEKFADLTRRVALGEANRAVASAENAGAARVPALSQENGSPNAAGDPSRTSAKVVDASEKHNYRIQAASPGLAMLSRVDGSPDDRPVEVAIGTQIPGYGKVVSIEQHGESWVVKADRGSIQ
jgi:hypothetical protein